MPARGRVVCRRVRLSFGATRPPWPQAETLDEAELRRKFDEIDTSGDGSLDEAEVQAVFSSIGQAPRPPPRESTP